jgi:hypothetical protein
LLPCLLLLSSQLIQLSLLLFDLRLLIRHTALKICVLVLARLHLVPDHRAPEKSHCRSDSRSRPCIPSDGADDPAQGRTANGSIYGAFFPCAERLGTAGDCNR